MDVILQQILSFILLYKYLALFGVAFLASLALPFPSDSAIVAASAFAGQGYFNIGLVILIASLGNISGDYIGYWVSRIYGRPILYKIGLHKVLDSKVFTWIESEVRVHSGVVVLLSRLNVFVTLTVNIVAGLSRMSSKLFLLYIVIGETIQVIIIASIGYFFGSNWQTIYGIFGKFTLVLFLFAALMFALAHKKAMERIIEKRQLSQK
jgi:membrane protein DedA with SNARE-associated domain